MKKLGQTDGQTGKVLIELPAAAKNIALNLLLDLAQYLNQTSNGLMRYSKTTLDFWTIVQKLF